MYVMWWVDEGWWIKVEKDVVGLDVLDCMNVFLWSEKSKMLYYVTNHRSVSTPPFATDRFISMQPLLLFYYDRYVYAKCLHTSYNYTILHTTCRELQYDSRWTCQRPVDVLIWHDMIYTWCDWFDWMDVWVERCLGGTSGHQRADRLCLWAVSYGFESVYMGDGYGAKHNALWCSRIEAYTYIIYYSEWQHAPITHMQDSIAYTHTSAALHYRLMIDRYWAL